MNRSLGSIWKSTPFRSIGPAFAVALLASAGTAQAQSAEQASIPLAAAPTLQPVPDASLAKDGNPLAGYRDGLFYLRDSNDDYRLYVQSRAHIDFYSYAGPGVSDTTLKPTVFLREQGGALGRAPFLPPLVVHDRGGLRHDSHRQPARHERDRCRSARRDASPRRADATRARKRPRSAPAPTDVYLNYRAEKVAQFSDRTVRRAPSRWKNRTSEKWGTPFMERFTDRARRPLSPLRSIDRPDALGARLQSPQLFNRPVRWRGQESSQRRQQR